MALKVEVISKEIIRPSTPTPLHLQTLKLSILDQYMPAVSLPLICFYSAKNTDRKNEKLLDHMKKSLPEVLTEFYPLAGRISGNQIINCNDEGINFIETQVIGHLSDVVSHPEADQLSQLFPVDNFYGEGPKVLLSIQANIFECGGLAIAMSISHKVGDSSSVSLFINHWAAFTRGDRNLVSPLFDTSSIFPPQDEAPPETPISIPSETLISKRFVFDARCMAALRAKISGNPTRVQAVSALIWGCAMNVVRMRTSQIKSHSVVSFPVNLRPRMVPPLPNSWFGNLAFSTLPRTTTENKPDLPILVSTIREAIRRVDGGYAKELQTRSGFLKNYALLMEAHGLHYKGELECFAITSSAGFPFYEADFGWGRPIWVSTLIPHKNIIALMDTECGQGIEAWVTLDEEDMAKFQCELDLIVFTSTNPRMN